MTSAPRSRWAALLLGVLAGCGEDGLPPGRRPQLAVHRQELRPTSAGAMWHFDATETVESYDSPGGGFKVHFTRAGRNAVPAADVGANGVPDFVEQVAVVYDEVSTYYAGTLGYRPPRSDAAVADNGGDGRFDVYLVDFNLSADGAFQLDSCPGPNTDTCIGYVVQENDFAGYGYPNRVVATRILGSHEYFHAVQNAYDKGQGAVADEGSAVWATEAFDPSLSDLEGFADGYLSKPDRSLDLPPIGPVPAFAYGSGVFFQFLSEKYDRPLLRKLWEHTENGQGLAGEGANTADPYWVPQLDLTLKAGYASSFAAAYQQFAIWNLYLEAMANPAKSYANGAAYPLPAMTVTALPYSDPKLRSFYASTQYLRLTLGGRAAVTAALVDVPGAAVSELGGMSLVVAVRRGSVWSEVAVLADPASGAVALDTTGANDAVVAVVNSNYSGASRRPGLCIGSPAEVAACRAALVAVDGGADAGVDAGVADAGEELDAGSPGGGGPGPAPGCGCGAAPLGFGVFALVLALVRRRSRAP
ncbi:MAG: MXAN_6640 family putative metalloprotease [Myxococcaceae bacterium]